MFKTSKVWSALVISCAACGSTFHATDTGSGGTGPGGSGSGGSFGSSGSGSSDAGSTASAGQSGKGGSGNVAGSSSTGGSVGTGGNVSSAGTTSSGGNVGASGSGAGGASGAPSGGAAGAGGSGGGQPFTCDAAWTEYLALRYKARICKPAQISDCSVSLPDRCGCEAPASQTNTATGKAQELLKSIENHKCPTTACLIACPPTGTISCALESASVYACTDSGTTSTM